MKFFSNSSSCEQLKCLVWLLGLEVTHTRVIISMQIVLGCIWKKDKLPYPLAMCVVHAVFLFGCMHFVKLEVFPFFTSNLAVSNISLVFEM